MIGMGFQEIMSFFVTNSKNVEFGDQGRDLKIMNPKSQDFSELRNSIFPEMLEFFQRNLRRSYPQRIFEIGRILGEENEEEHLAFAVADSKNGYSYIKGYLETFLKALTQKNYFIDGSNLRKAIINGRGGTILIDDICVGFIGEILPEILINYELVNPVTVAEIDVDKLFSAMS
jgi:phenylalanyl-tRNA synthetase beta chain